ncbi:TetR/AcrR family transcriptional regulator [Rhodococcus sp. B50]|uniref:TetR/AcrR family transcriptional regulator n=1 Tax=Rhodococcus sp. B50 TaxID=2682847 RepID=UPI001BD6AA6B|nr:TetR/AcrR family transcriptional regulator [Rhodococcus sp. B50]MBS9376281.1 putative HTH-type transcriptional regulator [Rhodococcus sp. B50]
MTEKATRESDRRNGRPRSEQSRRAILDATLDLLGHEVLSEITIASIASKAKVGKSTIYRWWPSRTALILEVIDGLPPIVAVDTGSLVSDLCEVSMQLSELLVASPLGKVLAHFAADRTAQNDPSVRDYFASRTRPISDVFERAVARGEFPAVPEPEMLIHIAMGPILNRVFFGAQPPDKEFITTAVRTVIAGFPIALASDGDAGK